MALGRHEKPDRRDHLLFPSGLRRRSGRRDALRPLHREGGHSADFFGSSLAVLGDIDGDGAPDFAAGAWQLFDDPEVSNTGYVRLISGRTGEIIRTLKGWREGQSFGDALSPFQDLDGDGRMDLAIEADYDLIQIYSSGTGEVLKEIKIESGL